MFASASQLFYCQSSFRNTEEVNRLSVNYVSVGLYRNLVLSSLLLLYNQIINNKTNISQFVMKNK